MGGNKMNWDLISYLLGLVTIPALLIFLAFVAALWSKFGKNGEDMEDITEYI